MTTQQKRIGVYPGTFDPITRGHLDIIERAAKLVDKLVIGVASDVMKDAVFSLEERVDMARRDVNSIQDKLPTNIEIEVIGFKGLLINFLKEQDAQIAIRGVRAVSDFEYEFKLFSANCKLDDKMDTIFLPAKDSTHFISATIVKELARLKGDVSSFVSPYVRKKLEDKFANV